MEWYDWFVYAAFGLYFAPVFFPSGSQTVQLLNTAAVFAVGFLMRPFGGWLMGWYADLYGRKPALMVSVVMMSAGSLIIGITPGYASIGVLAPVLLVTARLLQGLSVGGEYGTSATYLSEMATPETRGYYSSFQYTTIILGQLLALAVLIILQQTMSEASLQSWGWRIPFIIGAAGALVAFYLRRGIEETASFVATTTKGRKNLTRQLLQHPRAFLTVVGLTMGGTVCYYTFTTYIQKFLVNTAGWTRTDATLLSALTLFLYMFLQPIFGALSDRVGRRPLLIAFGALGSLMTVPFMTILSGTADFWTAFIVVMLALTVVTCYSSIGAVVKAELFPTEIRAVGVGLPHGIAASVFGGTAEYLALWFKQIGHETWFFWYVTVCVGLSLIVYIKMPDTKTHSAIREA